MLQCVLPPVFSSPGDGWEDDRREDDFPSLGDFLFSSLFLSRGFVVSLTHVSVAVGNRNPRDSGVIHSKERRFLGRSFFLVFFFCLAGCQQVSVKHGVRTSVEFKISFIRENTLKTKCFVIYDDKAKAYLPPFFLPEIGMAIRAFGDCVNDPKHNFGAHPADYTLFCTGTFDDRSGLLEPESTLLCVAHGIELRRRIEETARAQGNLPFRDDDFVPPKADKPGSVPANGIKAHE